MSTSSASINEEFQRCVKITRIWKRNIFFCLITRRGRKRSQMEKYGKNLINDKTSRHLSREEAGYTRL